MEIFKSQYNMSKECQFLIWEIEKILSDESLKFNEFQRVFEKRKGLNFSTINKMLRDKGLEFEEKYLYLALQILLSNYQIIVRNEYWYKETEYELLDRILWNHKSQQVHYSLEDDGLSNKVYLLLSDTHIGNEQLFNSRLLHNLYDYGIMMGAKKCFHLGDLFEGCNELLKVIEDITPKDIENFREEFCRQLNIFISEYPNPNPSELMTYGLIGNHDEAMNRFLQMHSYLNSCDLRKLSIYNQSFYMFPRSNWCAKLNGVDIHFNHKLYMSGIINDLKINNLTDIESKKELVGDLILDPYYDVLISGHLHKGIIYTELDYYKQKNKLYLGVPSTSNINVGGVVGYLVYMYPESNSMEVSILGCDCNLNIHEVDRISWEFNKMNQSLCRTL